MEPSYSSLSDQDLVAMAASGDREVFRELSRRYGRMIFSFARRALHNADDAEDVMQDTFIVAWQKLSAGLRPDAFGGWLWEIARRTILSAIRKKKRWKLFCGKVVHPGDLPHINPMDVPEPADEDWHYVFSVLERSVPGLVGVKLKPVADYMFRFSRQSGEFPPVRQIAEEFGLSHGTAERCRQRVVSACRETGGAHGLYREL